MEKTYPVELVGYRRLGDNGCSITVHSTLELTSDDIGDLDDRRGCQCLLFVTDVHAGLEMPDIDVEKMKASMVENKVYDKDVTPSEQQRRDIYVIQRKKIRREPTKKEFEEFYVKYMRKIHEHLLGVMDALDA